MFDKIENLNDTIIQHGKYNDRIYLMKLNKNNVKETIQLLNDLAIKNKYSKIFAKIPESLQSIFTESEYIKEAYIPDFCNDKEDIIFMSKFYDVKRAKPDNNDLIQDVIKVSKSKKRISNEFFTNTNTQVHLLKETEVNEAAKIYKKVFATYPFPIYNPDYLLKTMKDNIKYYNVKKDGKIIGLSSAEIDFYYKNAEMTDFAVLPEYRGKKLAIYLLNKMEADMSETGIKVVYTIARAVSYGMNSTFSKLNYNYSGTLINNTNISGNFESMNVWHKKL